VILAQFLRGICEAIDGSGADAGAMAAGLKNAAELAYRAVVEPREGTILTVAREAAAAAQGPDDLAGVLEAAARGAREALSHTPELLPVLRAEGVLDAGGIGLCVVLDAFAAAVTGREADPLPPLAGARTVRPRETGSLEFAYEVQYLLEAPDHAVERLRERLAAIGDSVGVIGGDGEYNVHVHTNDVGHAIEIGMDAGRPRAISVVEFEEQIAEARGLPVSMSATPVAVVVAADGAGVRALFEELGAGVVDSDEDLVATLDAAPAHDVIVLAWDAARLEAARDAAERSRRTVEVLDAGDVGRAFEAMLSFAPSRSFVDNLAEMRVSAAQARTARVALEPDVDPVDAAIDAVRDLGGGEVATVFAGAGAPEEERGRMGEALRRAFPKMDVEVRDTEQPGDGYVIAVE
jgi:dihydroxyacetone kinase-like predicted kinase